MRARIVLFSALNVCVRTVEFAPRLPARKLQAVSSLGFGLLNKVVLEFPSAFWREKLGRRRLLAHVSETKG